MPCIGYWQYRESEHPAHYHLKACAVDGQSFSSMLFQSGLYPPKTREALCFQKGKMPHAAR